MSAGGLSPTLMRVNTRIVFLIAQATTSGLILREAYSQGVLGADTGYEHPALAPQ